MPLHVPHECVATRTLTTPIMEGRTRRMSMSIDEGFVNCVPFILGVSWSCYNFCQKFMMEKWLYYIRKLWDSTLKKFTDSKRLMNTYQKVHQIPPLLYLSGGVMADFTFFFQLFYNQHFIRKTHTLFLKWTLCNAVHPKDTKFWHRRRCYESKLHPQDTKVWKKEKGLA